MRANMWFVYFGGDLYKWTQSVVVALQYSALGYIIKEYKVNRKD